MSEISYRDANAADAEALGAFAQATFTETFGHLYPPEDLAAYVEAKYLTHVVAAELADPDVRYVLALRGGEIGRAHV